MIMVTEISGLNYHGMEVEKNGETQRIAKPIKYQNVWMEAFSSKDYRSFYPLEIEYGTLTLKQFSKLGNVAGIVYDCYSDVKIDWKLG